MVLYVGTHDAAAKPPTSLGKKSKATGIALARSRELNCPPYDTNALPIGQRQKRKHATSY
jgi:hypothetical protein